MSSKDFNTAQGCFFQNMAIRKTSLIAKCNEKENGVLMRKIFIQSGWR